jgi:hypothetical protein
MFLYFLTMAYLTTETACQPIFCMTLHDSTISKLIVEYVQGNGRSVTEGIRLSTVFVGGTEKNDEKPQES